MPDTPPHSPSLIKGRLLTGFESSQQRTLELRAQYNDNMRGFYSGTLPPRLYIQTYFRNQLPRTKACVPMVDFSALHDPYVTNERHMYNRFVSNILRGQSPH